MGLLLFIFNSSTPSTIGAQGILVVFLLGFIVINYLMTMLVWGSSRAVSVLYSKLGATHRGGRIVGLSAKMSYYYSSVVSLGILMIIGIKSIGGGNFYDLLLVALFVVIGLVYVERRSS